MLFFFYSCSEAWQLQRCLLQVCVEASWTPVKNRMVMGPSPTQSGSSNRTTRIWKSTAWSEMLNSSMNRFPRTGSPLVRRSWSPQTWTKWSGWDQKWANITFNNISACHIFGSTFLFEWLRFKRYERDVRHTIVFLVFIFQYSFCSLINSAYLVLF